MKPVIISVTELTVHPPEPGFLSHTAHVVVRVLDHVDATITGTVRMRKHNGLVWGPDDSGDELESWMTAELAACCRATEYALVPLLNDACCATLGAQER